MTVSLSDVSKSFGQIQAVDQVSFDVQAGEIFGLLGPNGAGKTSIIRLILGILEPDAGQISMLGGSLDESRLNRIGYLPEERGLYQDISIERVLLYLARLKGLHRNEAHKRMIDYLSRMDLLEYRMKKVRELSKGMQQKVQVIATLLHGPELLILDEPFSALDPINTQLIKNLIVELKQKGVSIILSTHQLNHAEDLCDRIILIHHGRKILDGNLSELYRQFSDHAVTLQVHQALPDIPGVVCNRVRNNSYRLELSSDTNPQEVLKFLLKNGVVVEKFEIANPSLEQIFINAVQQA